MSKDNSIFNQNRRAFMKTTAAAATTAVISSYGMMPRAASASTLNDVHTMAASKAKELVAGRPITLKILQPSGSLGNVKPVADLFT